MPAASFAESESILELLGEISASPLLPVRRIVRPITEPSLVSKRHQFMVFLKPETTSIVDGANVSEALDLFYRTAADNAVEIGGISLVSGQYARQHGVISYIYATLDQVSREGVSAMSEPLRAKLSGALAPSHEPSLRILGGHQFLDTYAQYTPLTLQSLVDELGTIKIGAGIYATRLPDEAIVLLNGFYPQQLEWLTRLGHALLGFECQSDSPWREIRSNFVGSIVPASAEPSSFRRRLYEQRARLGIPRIDVAQNGIHVSPGTIEAIFQLREFFAPAEDLKLPYASTVFGLRLSEMGFSGDKLEALHHNPLARYRNELTPILDLTEDLDATNVLQVLREASFD